MTMPFRSSFLSTTDEYAPRAGHDWFCLGFLSFSPCRTAPPFRHKALPNCYRSFRLKRMNITSIALPFGASGASSCEAGPIRDRNESDRDYGDLLARERRVVLNDSG
jgi:hypothetical protein